MLLRYCPACGEKLPETSGVKFCGVCGTALTQFAANESEVRQSAAKATEERPAAGVEEPVRNFADVMRRYDLLVADLRRQGVAEGEVRARAEALFNKLKEQLPARSEKPGPVRSAYRQPPEALYSVVLKASGDKERLIKRLSEVLRRSRIATRMAVDMVPSIILYKSKASEIQAAIRIFDEEALPYTVIRGEVSADIPVEQIFSAFSSFDSEVQRLLRNAPGALWLGEQVQLVVAEVERYGEPGVVVVTDAALYFLSKPRAGQVMQWYIRPYVGLSGVTLSVEGGAALGIAVKNFPEEQLEFVDLELLQKVYEYVKTALTNTKANPQ